MNTPFAELEQKAHNYAATTFIESHGKQAEYNRLFIDKFAELIVRECLDVLNPDNDLTSMREEYGRKMSMRLIEQHFGVEE